MPRQEASDIFEMIKPIGKNSCNLWGIFLTIIFSYQHRSKTLHRDYGELQEVWANIALLCHHLTLCRGKETCGDIDILITRPTDDGKTHIGRCQP